MDQNDPFLENEKNLLSPFFEEESNKQPPQVEETKGYTPLIDGFKYDLPRSTPESKFLDSLQDSKAGPKEILPSKKRQKNASKKGSLKFCRRLCKIVVPLLERESFSTKIFLFFTDLMATLVGHIGASLSNRERFKTVSKVVFHRIWKKHRELLACTHHNKICLVTQAEWDSFFGKEGFIKELEKNTTELKEIVDLIDFRDDLDRNIFQHMFKNSLFILNTVFVNTVIYCDLLKDAKFVEGIPNYESFTLMAIEPWLCKHYNHAKEKFALECCNKCKICRSTTIPADFILRLHQARERLDRVKEFYQALNQPDLIDVTDEQVYTVFSFWGAQLAS